MLFVKLNKSSFDNIISGKQGILIDKSFERKLVTTDPKSSTVGHFCIICRNIPMVFEGQIGQSGEGDSFSKERFPFIAPYCTPVYRANKAASFYVFIPQFNVT